MAASTHECPAPGCDVQVPFHLLACGRHWSKIPRELQRTLLREWRDHPGDDSYFEARAGCLSALGIPDEEIAAMNAGVGATAAGTLA